MPDKKIVETLAAGSILIADGAWGTFLHKKGLKIGECPEEWNLTRPDDVRDIARSYVKAGARLIKTNSFGANRFRLAHYGLAGRVAELNRIAALISREEAGDEVRVMASVGPSGEMLLLGEVTEREMYDAYAEQMTALEEGGADTVCVETMSDVSEAVVAIKAAKQNTSLEVFCAFSFEKTAQGEYRTMMGVSPSCAAKACIAAGADVVGTNCGNGVERMVEIVREIKVSQPGAFLLVQSNAGLPKHVDGADVFPDSPEYMAGFVPALIDVGANIIGGCCGTTPEHIAAMIAVLGQ